MHPNTKDTRERVHRTPPSEIRDPGKLGDLVAVHQQAAEADAERRKQTNHQQDNSPRWPVIVQHDRVGWRQRWQGCRGWQRGRRRWLWAERWCRWVARAEATMLSGNGNRAAVPHAPLPVAIRFAKGWMEKRVRHSDQRRVYTVFATLHLVPRIACDASVAERPFLSPTVWRGLPDRQLHGVVTYKATFVARGVARIRRAVGRAYHVLRSVRVRVVLSDRRGPLDPAPRWKWQWWRRWRRWQRRLVGRERWKRRRRRRAGVVAPADPARVAWVFGHEVATRATDGGVSTRMVADALRLRRFLDVGHSVIVVAHCGPVAKVVVAIFIKVVEILPFKQLRRTRRIQWVPVEAAVAHPPHVLADLVTGHWCVPVGILLQHRQVRAVHEQRQRDARTEHRTPHNDPSLYPKTTELRL